ncbi:hypothetical protein BDY17DRAFT_324704 [Neohortaea acidophila]|uniref:Uncharacterized protein n=1 Tax=Neohortaea acidophila TaxID=245834 RepID=A0A6A6PT62_9PEZI|nr:uncharacterized protein BDY17DRAFT_324704 [Neohortaea acidophila]KAF2482417.1 hypothetical protein BDY17DRAFT_324704 [Neohortaea acidophila]
MGTRGLLAFIIRGRKKGTYNHSDSYPEGLGKKLVSFIKSLNSAQIQQMIENLEKIEWVKMNDPVPQDLANRYAAAGFTDRNLGRFDDWYTTLRWVQDGGCLQAILEGTLSHLIDYTNFENDRTFCEWIYVLDWEKRELEVVDHYHGIVREKRSFAEVSEEWMDVMQKKVYDPQVDEDGNDLGEDIDRGSGSD